MRKILALILAIAMSVSASALAAGGEGAAQVQQETPDELRQLYAQSAVLLDADSGRVLFAKNGYEQRPMASTTKIMTLIVTLENAQVDEVVTVSAYAASMPDVQLGIREGEQYRLKDLLYSLMLESHNDSAVAIAEHVGGSVEAFAELLNAKARDIGCYDTYFITPNGLDAQDGEGVHSTTAADLARMMRYCICQSPKKSEFLEITRTNSYQFGDTEGLRSFFVGNKNAFLNMMEGALSGKTGFTNNAGYCYVGALEQDGRTFVVALLACGWPNNRSYKWSDTRKLMSYGLEHYTYRDVWEALSFEKIQVEQGIPQSEDLKDTAYAELAFAENAKPGKLELLLKETEQVSVEVSLPEVLQAPTKPGSIVGEATYALNGETVAVFPITVETAVDAVTLQWCLERLFGKYSL